jgi:histone-arginine methyltransferase CARM1
VPKILLVDTGIDLRPLVENAAAEYMSQAVVGYFASDILISTDRAEHHFDFQTISLPALQTFEIPVFFRVTRTSVMHGLACWFDCNFLGSTAHVTLSTSPDKQGTHWYQCRLFLREPIAVNASQTVSGTLRFVASSKISYVITMTLCLDGTHISSTNVINLQDQMYHYLQTGSTGAVGGYGDYSGSQDAAQSYPYV